MDIVNSASDAIKSASEKTKEVISNVKADIGRLKGKFVKSVGDQNNKDVAEVVNDDPEEEAVNIYADKVFAYPLGINQPENDNAAPYIRITGFKYKRRKDNETRVYGFAENPDDSKLLTEFETQICLPFYGSLTQGYDSITSAQPPNILSLLQQTNMTEAMKELGETGAGTIMGLLDKARNVSSMDELVTAAKGGAGSKLFQMGAASLAASAFGARNSLGDIVKQGGLSFGVALNPATEMLYEGQNLQRYELSFTLVPRSRDEHEQIDGIICKLRELSMGKLSLSSSRALINYPAIFNLDWCTAEGAHIIGPLPSADCYLDNVSVVYNPQGRSNLYNGDMPVMYQLNLGFIELRALYRDDIQRLRELTNQPTLGVSGDYQHLRQYNDKGIVDNGEDEKGLLESLKDKATGLLNR